MEIIQAFIPLLILGAIIIVFYLWREANKHPNIGPGEQPRASGIEPISKKAAKAESPSPIRKTGSGATVQTFASVDRSKVFIASGIQLAGLDMILAEHLQGRSDNYLELDDEAVLKDKGQIPVWVGYSDYSGKFFDKLGRLENEVAKEIRGAEIAHQLEVDFHTIWVSEDRDRALVRVNLLGTKDHLVKLLKYRISLRREKKANTPGQFQGHPPEAYADDLRLYEVTENWSAYEELARKLMEAEAETSTTGYSNSALALARYYRDNKRYEDERVLLSGLEEKLGVPLHDTLASRLRRVTQLAAKAKLKN